MGLVFGGAKIPGHTGTEYKHKKVFKKSKELLREHDDIYLDIKVETREKEYSNTKVSILFKVISVLSITIFSVLMFALFARFATVEIHKNGLTKEYFRSLEALEKKEVALILYKSAKDHLKAGNLNHAQEKIVLFLNIYPKSINGLKLTHDILVQQCKVNNQFCREAKEYEDYLKSVQ